MPRRALLVALSIVALATAPGGAALAVEPPASDAVAEPATTAAAVPEALVGSLAWPVPRGPVLRAFAAPTSRWGAGHRGVDVAAQPGAAVVAATSGTVTFAGTVVDRPLVTIRVEGVPWEVLVTVEPVEPSVGAGDVVAAGDRIGTLQGGHRPCGACVHLGVRIDDAYVNPLALLGAERAVLLPLDAPTATAYARGCAVRYDAVSRSSETCV